MICVIAILERFYDQAAHAFFLICVGLFVYWIIVDMAKIALGFAKDHRMWSHLRMDIGNSIAPGVFLKLLSNLRTDSMRTRILRIIRQNSLFQATPIAEHVLTCLAIAIEQEKRFPRNRKPDDKPGNIKENPAARMEIFEACPEFLAWYKEYSTAHSDGLRRWSSDTLDEIARLQEQVRASMPSIGQPGSVQS